ncbi:glycosyltransferase [Xylanibacter ruminicola]|nr:glycosyltransferase [Xylanibacter ruminicola]
MTKFFNTNKIGLSIIIPVYNVENYIHTCIESAYNQDLDDNLFELIIINDGTKDNSMDVISDIVNQHNNITIINQQNQGLSIARNNGIAKASGEYIIFLDSDDLLLRNSLPELLNLALSSEADLVVADYQEKNNEEIENDSYIVPEIINIKEKTGKQILLEDLNPRKCYVWRTLYRREFLIKENIQFIPGIFFEDIPFTHNCLLNANKCLITNQILYIYRKGNQSSATYKLTQKKAHDMSISISSLWELSKKQNLESKVCHRLKDNTFVAFSILMYAIVNDIDEHKIRLEIIHYLKQLIPDLHFKHGFKQRIIDFMYHYMPHTYIFIRLAYKMLSRLLK